MSIADAMVGFIAELKALGAQMPIYAACVGLNGSLVFLRYSEEDGKTTLVTEILADHSAGKEWQLPVNVLLVDARGEGYRAAFKGFNRGPELVH